MGKVGPNLGALCELGLLPFRLVGDIFESGYTQVELRGVPFLSYQMQGFPNERDIDSRSGECRG